MKMVSHLLELDCLELATRDSLGNSEGFHSTLPFMTDTEVAINAHIDTDSKSSQCPFPRQPAS